MTRARISSCFRMWSQPGIPAVPPRAAEALAMDVVSYSSLRADMRAGSVMW